MDTKPQNAEQQRKPRRTFSKPFNPIGAIIEYLHIVVAIALIGTILTVPYVILKKKPKYSSEGIININPNMPKILYRVEDSSFIHSFEDWMRTQVKVITSHPVLEWAIKDYESQGFKWQFPGESMLSACNRLNSRIKVVQIRDTQLLTVSMEAKGSNGLAEMINSVIKGYINSIDSSAHTQDTYKLDVLAKEREKVQKELDDGYRQLEDISRKYGTAITEEKNLSIYFESLADLKKTYNKMVADRITAESRMKALEAKGGILKGLPLTGLVADRMDNGLGVSGLINQIKIRIQEVREQMVGLTEDNPRHILLKRRQQDMEAQVERLQAWVTKNQEQVLRGKLLDDNQQAIEGTRVDYSTSRDAEKLLLKELDRVQKEVLEYNTVVLHAQTKRHEIQRLMESLTRINERTDQIHLEFASPGRISVTSWAQKPEGPNVDPRGKLVPICFIVSLMLGVGTALGREMMDSRIKRPADAEKLLGFPLTGFVLRADEENIPPADLYSLHMRHPRCQMAQQMAKIVVKLERERMDHGSKVFAFTGLGDGCGVTTLAMNFLAMSTVPPQRRLYLDLNTRNPADSREPLKSAMKASQPDHLQSNFLNGSNREFPFVFFPCSQDPQCTQCGKTGKHCDFPCASIQNNQLLHASENLKELLEELKPLYDLIVVDLPPVLLSANSQMAVGMVDVAVLVAMARHSLWGELMRSLSILDDSGVKVVSVILNRVGFVRGGYLRSTLKGYHTPEGTQKKKQIGTFSLTRFLQMYRQPFVDRLQRMFRKR